MAASPPDCVPVFTVDDGPIQTTPLKSDNISDSDGECLPPKVD
jgi:hypothetical protein